MHPVAMEGNKPPPYKYLIQAIFSPEFHLPVFCVKKSTNFLTALKLVTRSQYDEHLDKDFIKSTSRKVIGKKQITIEQINYEDY